MAQVEIQAGPHRFVSLMSREAADELGLEPGVLAVASVKADERRRRGARASTGRMNRSCAPGRRSPRVVAAALAGGLPAPVRGRRRSVEPLGERGSRARSRCFAAVVAHGGVHDARPSSSRRRTRASRSSFNFGGELDAGHADHPGRTRRRVRLGQSPKNMDPGDRRRRVRLADDLRQERHGDRRARRPTRARSRASPTWPRPASRSRSASRRCRAARPRSEGVHQRQDHRQAGHPRSRTSSRCWPRSSSARSTPASST